MSAERRVALSESVHLGGSPLVCEMRMVTPSLPTWRGGCGGPQGATETAHVRLCGSGELDQAWGQRTLHQS